jgi:hypothetical protein
MMLCPKNFRLCMINTLEPLMKIFRTRAKSCLLFDDALLFLFCAYSSHIIGCRSLNEVEAPLPRMLFHEFGHCIEERTVFTAEWRGLHRQ